jgi:hypothetical protein
MDYLVCAVLIGGGATALVDVWASVRRRVFGTPPPRYALVGRWLAYMTRGRFVHPSIAAASPMRAGEPHASSGRCADPKPHHSRRVRACPLSGRVAAQRLGLIAGRRGRCFADTDFTSVLSRGAAASSG